MTQFPSRPPRTRKELFERVRAVIAHGPYVMPEESRYNGSGAPGVFLEDLLGATAGGHDIPDAVGWELKWHSDRTSLVTLFVTTKPQSIRDSERVKRRYFSPLAPAFLGGRPQAASLVRGDSPRNAPLHRHAPPHVFRHPIRAAHHQTLIARARIPVLCTSGVTKN